MMCGHFQVPFLTFFGATVIGKAFIKAVIQVSFHNQGVCRYHPLFKRYYQEPARQAGKYTIFTPDAQSVSRNSNQPTHWFPSFTRLWLSLAPVDLLLVTYCAVFCIFNHRICSVDAYEQHGQKVQLSHISQRATFQRSLYIKL